MNKNLITKRGFGYEEFYDRCIINYEEFSFTYNNFKIWISNDKEGFYCNIFSIDKNLSMNDKVIELFKFIKLLDQNIFDLWKDIEIYEVDEKTKICYSTRFNGYFEKFIDLLVLEKKQYKIKHSKVELDIASFKMDFLDNIVVNLKFADSLEFLQSKIFDGKTIELIWQELY